MLHFFSDDQEKVHEAIDHLKFVARRGMDGSDRYYEYDSFLKKGIGVKSESRWRYIKAEADCDYCESQFIYGKYLYSFGSRQSRALCLEYFKKSAKNKHSEGMFAYAALSIHEFDGKWSDFERYYERAAKEGVLLAQYNYGVHLSQEPDLERQVNGAKFLRMAAQEVLLRREAKMIKVNDSNSDSYPLFMYSPIPERFVLRATDNYLIEHLSKSMGLLSRMTWDEIMSPKTLTIRY